MSDRSDLQDPFGQALNLRRTSVASPSSLTSANGAYSAGPGDETARSGEPPQLPVGGRLKRLADIVIASGALMAALPIMIIVAALIRWTMGGPVVYAHERVGFQGRRFRCYKFRSMVTDADEALRLHLASNPEAAEQWAKDQKLKHDPRITFLGRLLRKSSLDELPQLFNILKGEMSCVGPRPIVADELGRYGSSACEYLATRPGLTGLWQVTGRSSVDYARRVALDSQYVRNWSFRNDLVILALTAFAVIRFDEVS